MTPWTSPMSYLRPNSPPDHTCVIKCLAKVSVGVEKKVEKVEKEKKEKVRRKKRK